jgi:hypothetical protein
MRYCLCGPSAYFTLGCTAQFFIVRPEDGNFVWTWAYQSIVSAMVWHVNSVALGNRCLYLDQPLPDLSFGLLHHPICLACVDAALNVTGSY